MTQFTDPKTLNNADIESGAIFAPKFDANGLVAVVTQEASSGDVLMVAHMNADAIAETLRSGYATYWSRSRAKLWKKGESSGELQEVVEIRADCDQDALLLIVNQTGHGAACHTGRKSCFYRKVETVDGQTVLADSGSERLFDPADVYGR
ncbi:phosphoribosyl-AMP cyclohydrolase [Pelagibacterium luteolum]|uniref:Phosphoribosyl-AMP cyclohydrolase n=1 Tax=Pelagibacterium luteolum TaxID=440168 RepID=A0A1G7XH63_9HYPH|nr:phosphoribosyl-AMP cyclohydrolase [Pelagibacterium luteolum]SDG83467.1 phosphoribosyl-AMP cyclohydrolase [Pelagibacterium luteolum]